MVKCSDFSCKTRNIWERPGVAIMKTDPKQQLYKSMQIPPEEDDWNGDVPPVFTPVTGMDPHPGAPGRTPRLGPYPKGIVQILCSLMAPRNLIWRWDGGIWTLGLHCLCTRWWAQSPFPPTSHTGDQIERDNAKFRPGPETCTSTIRHILSGRMVNFMQHPLKFWIRLYCCIFFLLSSKQDLPWKCHISTPLVWHLILLHVHFKIAFRNELLNIDS